MNLCSCIEPSSRPMNVRPMESRAIFFSFSHPDPFGLSPRTSTTLISRSSVLSISIESYTMQSAFASIARPSTSRTLLAASSRRAFHTGKPSAAAVVADKTAQIHEYVPGGPVLRGGVNDAHKFPEPHKSHGSYHWQFERLLSVALIPITISTFAVSPSAHPILDGVLGASLIIHSHIGFDACLVDYLHERKFPKAGPAASWALRAATVGALFGVYEFNTNDVGLTELIRKTWNA